MFLFQVYEVQLDFFHVLIESELSGDYLNILNSHRVNPPLVDIFFDVFVWYSNLYGEIHSFVHLMLFLA